MNLAHVHMVLNHFPVIGLFFAAIPLALGLYRKNQAALTAGFHTTILSSVFAVPAYFTGEPAEDVIKNLPSFSETLIEPHEQAAFYAIIFMVLCGIAASTAVWYSFKNRRTPKALSIAVFVLVLFTLTVVTRTAYLGGMISHPEIRGP